MSEKRKIRRIGLNKPIQVRRLRRKASPEIRSLQKGRIQMGSVAPLLSRRAKILAMKTCYNDYSDDEKYDVSDKITENSSSEDDCDNELYDYDRHHRSYSRRHRPFVHFKRHRENYEEKLIPSSLSFPFSTSTTQHFLIQPETKPYELDKSVSTNSVPIAIESTISAKIKKSTARYNSKDENKRKKILKATQSGPITRSRRAALMDKND